MGTCESGDRGRADAAVDAQLEGAEYYSHPGMPNPAVVDFFAAEAGLFEFLEERFKMVDILTKKNRTPEMLKLNPDGGVPFLKLGNGKVIAETLSMCEYLDHSSKVTKDSLFGTTAEEKAVISMWQRRCEQHIILNIFSAFRTGPGAEMFKTRGAFGQLPPDSEHFKQYTKDKCKWLDEHMGATYICMNKFTFVDIQLYAVLAFTKFDPTNLSENEADRGKMPDGWFPDAMEGCSKLSAWFTEIGKRPAAKKMMKAK